MRDNGQIEGVGQWKDGKSDGLTIWWYPNGQKRSEDIYKDGKLLTAIGWKPNGEKCPHTNVVDGNGVGVSTTMTGGNMVTRPTRTAKESETNPSLLFRS